MPPSEWFKYWRCEIWISTMCVGSSAQRILKPHHSLELVVGDAHGNAPNWKIPCKNISCKLASDATFLWCHCWTREQSVAQGRVSHIKPEWNLKKPETWMIFEPSCTYSWSHSCGAVLELCCSVFDSVCNPATSDMLCVVLLSLLSEVCAVSYTKCCEPNLSSIGLY